MSAEESRKIVVAGGSGFIGGALLREAKERGWETVVLSRSEKPIKNADRVVKWDGRSLGAWTSELEGAQAVVNLSGVSLMGRQTDAYKKKIVSSRVEPTTAIAEAIQNSKEPPKAWINASAVGYYGSDTGDRIVCEATSPGGDWLAEVCEQWEAPVLAANTPDTRKIRARFGLVMGRGGGMFEPLHKVTKLFLGSAFGSGQQYMSWIHIHDLARMILWAAENEEIFGILNATAPTPAKNADFMASLRRAVGRPPVPPVPAPLVKVAAKLRGLDPMMLLGGTRAVPMILQARGFKFEFENLNKTFDDLTDSYPKGWRG